MTIIALIGPRASGKSTIGQSISEKIGWKFVDFDEYMINYFKHQGFELGFDPQKDGGYIYHLKKTKNIDDDQAWKEYYKVNNRELINFIDKNKSKNMVLDLGGRTVTKRKGEGDDELENIQKKLKFALRAHAIVIYLSYSRFFHKKTVDIFFERERPRSVHDWANDEQLREIILRDYKIAKSQRKFADYSFFSGRSTADDISKKIIRLLKRLRKV